MRQVELDIIIAAGSADSAGADVKGAMLVGIYTDSDFAGANLAVEVSNDGGATWFDVQDDAGADIGIVISASEFAVLPPLEYNGWAENIRFVTDVAQGGGTPSTLKLVVLAD